MIERRTLWSMAVGCGLAVANLYYAQPLLADMGRYFGTTDRRMGMVAMLSQVGYALGLLLFVPLGDRLERRSFILVTCLGATHTSLHPEGASQPKSDVSDFGQSSEDRTRVDSTSIATRLEEWPRDPAFAAMVRDAAPIELAYASSILLIGRSRIYPTSAAAPHHEDW